MRIDHYLLENPPFSRRVQLVPHHYDSVPSDRETRPTMQPEWLVTDVRSFMNEEVTLPASPRPTSRRLGPFLKAALTVLEGIPHEPLEISLRYFKKISIELLLQLPKQRLKAALASNWPADST